MFLPIFLENEEIEANDNNECEPGENTVGSNQFAKFDAHLADTNISSQKAIKSTNKSIHVTKLSSTMTQHSITQNDTGSFRFGDQGLQRSVKHVRQARVPE